MKLFSGLGAIALALGLALSSAVPQAPASAQQAVAAFERPTGWANDRGDLPKDPDFSLGVLPNGMRYLILPNQSPPGQVAMRLVIDAGSMHERPGEEGVAHLLEHLAFRGTKSLPDGDIQRRLEALGLRMAADVNASTSPTQTIFKLDFARNDAVSLETGLLILREMASEMTLAQEMVDAERGVVLAEERMRAGPGEEAYKQMIRMQVGDHPYSRSPIGLRQVIETVSAPQIRAFYDAFYRPERATLVIVGDVKPEQVTPRIADRFSDWTGRGPAGAEPAPVMKKPQTSDLAVLVTPGSGGTSIMLQWFEPYYEPAPTKAERRRALVESLGADAVRRRMQAFNDEAGRPARAIGSAAPSMIPGVWRGQTAFSAGVIDPAKTIEVMVKAHRQAVEFGVTQEELDRVKALRIEAARQAAQTGLRGESDMLAQGLAEAMDADPVFVSPKDSLALLQEQVKTITLKEVNEALRTRFKGEPVMIYRSAVAPKGGEAALRRAWSAAMAAPVKPYVPEAVKPWPYTDFGAPGKVAQRQEVEDLGVILVRFENGVRLTVKPTDFEKDDVLVRVRLGLGRIGMPRDRIDASDMGYAIWSTGGLGKLSPVEQARTLAGKRVMASVRSADDAYEISNGGGGFTTREDFPLQMELMAAMVTDPGLRPVQWASMLEGSDRSEESAPLTPGGVLGFNLDRMLHANDLRWTYNTKEMRDTWKPEDAIAYIRPIIENSPIEVVVVGDIAPDEAIKEVARTFGALPARKETPEPPGLRDVTFPAGTPDPVVLRHEGRADQGAVVIAWPAQDALSDLHAYRVNWVLSQMLRDEATRYFRSENGATYSPAALAEFSQDLPGYGYIGLTLEIPPDQADASLSVLERIAARLAAFSIPSSEVTRITGPRIEATRRDMATNRYWASMLAGAQADPRKLDLLRTQITGFEAITPADIQAAAQRFLRPEKAWKLKVVARQD